MKKYSCIVFKIALVLLIAPFFIPQSSFASEEIRVERGDIIIKEVYLNDILAANKRLADEIVKLDCEESSFSWEIQNGAKKICLGALELTIGGLYFSVYYPEAISSVVSYCGGLSHFGWRTPAECGIKYFTSVNIGGFRACERDRFSREAANYNFRNRQSLGWGKDVTASNFYDKYTANEPCQDKLSVVFWEKDPHGTCPLPEGEKQIGGVDYVYLGIAAYGALKVVSGVTDILMACMDRLPMTMGYFAWEEVLTVLADMINDDDFCDEDKDNDDDDDSDEEC